MLDSLELMDSRQILIDCMFALLGRKHLSQYTIEGIGNSLPSNIVYKQSSRVRVFHFGFREIEIVTSKERPETLLIAYQRIRSTPSSRILEFR